MLINGMRKAVLPFVGVLAIVGALTLGVTPSGADTMSNTHYPISGPSAPQGEYPGTGQHPSGTQGSSQQDPCQCTTPTTKPPCMTTPTTPTTPSPAPTTPAVPVTVPPVQTGAPLTVQPPAVTPPVTVSTVVTPQTTEVATPAAPVSQPVIQTGGHPIVDNAPRDVAIGFGVLLLVLLFITGFYLRRCEELQREQEDAS